MLPFLPNCINRYLCFTLKILHINKRFKDTYIKLCVYILGVNRHQTDLTNQIELFSGSACSNPTLSATSFTTQDATILTNIAYVSQIKLECDGEVAVRNANCK